MNIGWQAQEDLWRNIGKGGMLVILIPLMCLMALAVFTA